ncbi:uncharacterized protein LOC119872141 [Canis lupus familiaris]|uniref:uncharacterized protein LOC119872141 n=1 Tax=Canis lupus familiaris TaxID=9615 RepID=UPI0018F2C521|nr:uncharacterized protein LOC119872141 [Canis lupus familiaris]
MHREPDVGFDPGSPGSRPGPKAGAKPLRHPDGGGEQRLDREPQLARAVPKACTLQPTSPYPYLHRPAPGGYNSCACLCPQPASHQWPSRPLELPARPSGQKNQLPLTSRVLTAGSWRTRSPLKDMAWEPKLTPTNSQMTEEALPSALLAWLLGSTSKMSSSSGFSKYLSKYSRGRRPGLGAHTSHCVRPRDVSSSGLGHHSVDNSVGLPSIPHREALPQGPRGSPSP